MQCAFRCDFRLHSVFPTIARSVPRARSSYIHSHSPQHACSRRDLRPCRLEHNIPSVWFFFCNTAFLCQTTLLSQVHAPHQRRQLESSANCCRLHLSRGQSAERRHHRQRSFSCVRLVLQVSQALRVWSQYHRFGHRDSCCRDIDEVKNVAGALRANPAILFHVSFRLFYLFPS